MGNFTSLKYIRNFSCLAVLSSSAPGLMKVLIRWLFTTVKRVSLQSSEDAEKGERGGRIIFRLGR